VSCRPQHLPSILFGQHDRNHAFSDRGIRRVWGVIAARLIVIIDLEKYRVAVDLERAKVMFLVWVVGVAEIVIDRNSFDDASDGFGAECGNTGRNKGRE
jgi:hypothetical protein